MQGRELKSYYGSVDRAASSIQKAYKRSKSRSRQTRAASSIQKAYKKSRSRSRQKRAATTPLSKHYAESARFNNQPSILAFRRNCHFFPHPVEIYSDIGISIPVDKNYADVFKSDEQLHNFPKKIIDFFELKEWQHVNRVHWVHQKYKPEFLIWQKSGTYPIDPKEVFTDAQLRPGNITIGLLIVTNKDKITKKRGTHLLFYEMRVDQDGPSAVIIDPNGNASEWLEEIERFFSDIPFTIPTTRNINTSDKRARIYLTHLGFTGDVGDLKGYCAVISTYYLVDYMCTNQWVKRDISHFVRASEEWLYSLQEQKYGVYTPFGTELRIV